ncbi:MAG: hypothetical protein ABIG84_01410 [archaeon]
METKEHLEEIERKISPLYRYSSIKTVWLTKSGHTESDNLVCVSIIVNDTKKGYTKEFREIRAYLKKFENSNRQKYVFDIYKLSEYWRKLVYADPKLYAEMRLSIILYDPAGFFAPLKVLLLEGKMPCTRESAYALMTSAPEKIMRVHKNIKLDVLTKLYNLVVDAAQAPIVLKGYDPPIPKALPGALKSIFSGNELQNKDISILENIIKYYKDVEHGKITTISGSDLHIFLEASEIFIKDMEDLMKKITNPQSTKKSTTTR